MTQEDSIPVADANALANRLAAGLRARRSYLTIYEYYRKGRPKEDVAELLDVLVDDALDAISLLSSAMRRLDRRPVQVEANEKLLGQGLSRKGTLSKLNFILVGVNNSLEWYAEQMAAGDPADIQSLWQELMDQEIRHRDQIKEILAHIELALGRPPTEDDW